MTNEAKLNGLKTYVNERLDLHNDWNAKINVNKMIEELENRIKDLNEQIIVDRELMRELIDLQTLKTEVHYDIEKVWMYDTSMQYGVEKYRTLLEADSKERSKIIERVFYKIANKWID